MDIIQSLKEKEISKFVFVKPLCYDSSEKGCSEFYDARSAAFFAMGEAIKTGESVALILPGMYLTSVYTAITEAWFQKASVIVVACFDKISDLKTAWMDRCVKGSISFGVNEVEQYDIQISELCQKKGPVLINIVGDFAKDTAADYSEILKNIEKNSIEQTEVLCYNANVNKTFEKLNITNIECDYKYGIFSKYIGMCAAGKTAYLCCTADCLLLDLNIFRTRYKQNSMKIIVLDKEDICAQHNLKAWFESNGWNYNECIDNTSETIKQFCSQDYASILVVK